jgi:electron transfer flavoprotein alpha subunit
MTVLCLVETDAAGAADVSLRALAFARRLAASAHETVAAVVIGAAGQPLAAQLSAAGAAERYAVTADGLDGYAPQAWARALAGLAGQTGASAVVAAATDHGSEVLAQLGAITGLPLAANCVSAVRTGAGPCQLVRNRWAGSLLEDAELESVPALLTVATDAVPADPVPADPPPADPVPADPVGPEPMITKIKGDVDPTKFSRSSDDRGTGPAQAGWQEYRAALEPADLAMIARESAERGGGVSLATARVVVGGGRGVGGPDGFGPLEELAALLGGVLGVSRVVTSQGWRPHQQQVGQTGTRISPDLYLACGISGAIQHMAGCLSAKHIVAVNTDPDAPIIARADYAVIGDLSQVIPALIAALRQRGSG